MIHKNLILILIVVGGLFLFGCRHEEAEPKIKIILEDNREIRIELFPDKAPKTVKNFLNHVDSGYYNGVVIHQAIEDVFIQSGGYYIKDETIEEKPTVATIDGEFSSNGFTGNDLKHDVGVISMARRVDDVNSASTKFFICSSKNEALDGQYAAFGKTMDEESARLVIELSKAPTRDINEQFQEFPFPTIVIKKIERIKP